MNINEAFPSEFLKAGDLNGKPYTLTMSHVTMDKIGDETKPVVHFSNAKASLVLNKTNAQSIVDMHGPETDDWTGRDIVVVPAMTDFQGKRVACIRIDVPQRQVEHERMAEPIRIPQIPDQTDGDECPF